MASPTPGSVLMSSGIVPERGQRSRRRAGAGRPLRPARSGRWCPNSLTPDPRRGGWCRRSSTSGVRSHRQNHGTGVDVVADVLDSKSAIGQRRRRVRVSRSCGRMRPYKPSARVLVHIDRRRRRAARCVWQRRGPPAGVVSEAEPGQDGRRRPGRDSHPRTRACRRQDRYVSAPLRRSGRGRWAKARRVASMCRQRC